MDRYPIASVLPDARAMLIAIIWLRHSGRSYGHKVNVCDARVCSRERSRTVRSCVPRMYPACTIQQTVLGEKPLKMETSDQRQPVVCAETFSLICARRCFCQEGWEQGPISGGLTFSLAYTE